MLISTGLPEKLVIQADEHFSRDDLRLSVVYPGDNATEVGTCYLLAPEKIDTVLAAAETGFHAFKRSTYARRGEILNKLADLIDANAPDLAKLITLESGKPLKLSQHEVQRAVGVCRGYARELGVVKPQTFVVEGREATVRQFPLGPVLAITPWNFPLNLIVHKLAPAIAAGCSITVKPASKTPLTALYLGRLASEAGYPAINVIPCTPDVAEQLVRSDVFRKLSFTGSDTVGWRLKSIAGKKAVTLELGGNAACIVEDVDPAELAAIAARIAQGSFWYSGQICISVQRIFVNHRLHDNFLKAFVAATRALKVGDPMLPETDIGPMITLDDLRRTRNLIKDAIQQGANVVYGGNTFNSYTMNPTIMNRTTPEMAVNAEEVFAPIVTVQPYETFEDALALANQSRFGLQAGVYTQDLHKARRAYETLDVGGVMVNEVPTFRLDYLPYGGVKDSGLGREGVLTGMAEMSYLKTMILPL